MIPAAEQLLGLTLDPDWEVIEKVSAQSDRTQAEFSVGYIVKNRAGKRAFCKALDWSSAFEEDDLAEALQRLSAAFLFERDLLEQCRQRKMRRVVHAIASGTVTVPDAFPGRVSYLIFEEADGDSRDVLDATDVTEFAVGLALVRDCAVALGQLHRAKVTHQDVKPANLLGWRQPIGWSAKLADLGRAFCESLETPHADLACPGDTTWAPPELLYGWPEGKMRIRHDRELSDMFSLGSLLCFTLVRVPYGALLAMELERENSWENWQGGYESARALLSDAHEQAGRRLHEVVDQAIRPDVTELVADMCHPLIEERGRLSRRGGGRSSFLLERYISRLDRLSKQHPVRRQVRS